MSDLQRDWFERENQHRNPDLILHVQRRLEGLANAEAFMLAAADVVGAAEALRTTLLIENGVHVQRVWDKALDGTVYVEDLRQLPAEQAHGVVLEIMAQERWREFDLTSGPLLRIGLVQVTAAYAVISVVAHHILVDGWSMGLVLSNLADAYARRMADGNPTPTAAVGQGLIQLREWVARESAASETPVASNTLRYWREALSDVTPLHVPYDRELQDPERHSRSWADFSLPNELAHALILASTQLSVMPSATLMTAYLRALATATGSPSVASLYLVNRRTRENAAVLGCLINAVIIPLHISDDRTKDARAVQRALLNGHRHQGVFIERVLAECGLPTRAIDAIFIFDKADYGNESQFGPHEVSRFAAQNPPRPDRFGSWWENLTFRVVHEDDRMYGAISYNRLAYDAATMERFVGSFLEELALIVDGAKLSASISAPGS